MVVTARHKRGLWLASASGRIERQLTRERDGDASFSPNGRKIVFQRLTRGHRYAIVTRDRRSGRTRTIFTAAGAHLAQVPL